MNIGADLSQDGGTLTVSVLLSIRKRGGRRQVVLPDGATTWASQRDQIDSTAVKALARAFRWRKLLEDGVYSTIEEIAAAERVNSSYLSRVLRLTLLAPEIVESILNGQHAPELTAARLFRPFPVRWEDQMPALNAS